MSNALKDFLSGLAQSGSNPVGTALNAYGIGMKRRQALIAEQLKRQALGIQEAQASNASERNRLLGISNQTAIDKLAHERETSDLGYIESKGIAEAQGGIQRDAMKDAGYEAFDAFEPIQEGKVELPTGESFYTNERKPDPHEVVRNLRVAAAKKGLLTAAQEGLKEKAKREQQLKFLRKQYGEGLTPGIAAVNARANAPISATDQAKIDAQLGKASIETGKYTGRKTLNTELRTQLSTPARSGQVAGSVTNPTPQIPQTQTSTLGVNDALDQEVRDSIIDHDAAKSFLTVAYDPARRKVALQNMDIDQLKGVWHVLSAMARSGMITLTPEEIDIVAAKEEEAGIDITE